MVSLKHTCAHICGLNLLGQIEFSPWDTVCRHSPLNNICLDCTLPEAMIHMCLCLCECFMSGLCRLLGFAAAYLYSVLWNIFQTLWLTWGDPTPIRLRLWSLNTENWHVQVEMWCLHHLCLRSLHHLYAISICYLSKCVCLLVSWKMWTNMSCRCSSEIRSVIDKRHSSKVISCTVIWCVSA